MGYREDINSNFPKLTIPRIDVLAFAEDLLIDKALDRRLQDAQNVVVNRTKAAKNEYLKVNPEANQMDIEVEDLEGFDRGLVEAHRQAFSFLQGTISGKVRDSKDKIKNHLETQIEVK